MNATSTKGNSLGIERSHSEVAISIADISKLKDPAMLASIIEKNQTTLREGWAELDRLTARLEALNARERSIIQKDLQTPQPSVKATTETSSPN